jgi:hypothetical protein
VSEPPLELTTMYDKETLRSAREKAEKVSSTKFNIE